MPSDLLDILPAVSGLQGWGWASPNIDIIENIYSQNGGIRVLIFSIEN